MKVDLRFKLTDITVDDSLLHCRDMFCLKHKEKISELYSTVITSCINASDHIPTTSKRSGEVKPGWNDNVQLLKSEALSCYGNVMAAPEMVILQKCVELLGLDTIELLDILIDMSKPLE